MAESKGNFSEYVSEKYQIAVDMVVHAPDKQGDNRNFHAHLLLTTRKTEQDHIGKIKLTDKQEQELIAYNNKGADYFKKAFQHRAKARAEAEQQNQESQESQESQN